MSAHHRSREQQSGLPGSSHRRSEREDRPRAGNRDHVYVSVHEALRPCMQAAHLRAYTCRTTETRVTKRDQ